MGKKEEIYIFFVLWINHKINQVDHGFFVRSIMKISSFLTDLDLTKQIYQIISSSSDFSP